MHACGIEDCGVCGTCCADGEPLLDGRSRRAPDFTPKTLICAIFAHLTPSRGDENICMYARVADYHEVVGGYLAAACAALKREFADSSFAPFTDASPVREVAAAAAAGLGVVGRNGLLITPRWGSYVFIGCIVTDLDVGAVSEQPKSCLNCGRCVRACPGKALDSGDMSLCASAVSQKKGELSDGEKALVAATGFAWGCDICQNVCPMNADAQFTRLAEFTRSVKGIIGFEDCADVTHRAYGWRGAEVLRRNLEITGKL